MNVKTLKKDKRERARAQALKSLFGSQAPTIESEIKRYERYIGKLTELYQNTYWKHGEEPHYKQALISLYCELERATQRLMRLKVDKLNSF